MRLFGVLYVKVIAAQPARSWDRVSTFRPNHGGCHDGGIARDSSRPSQRVSESIVAFAPIASMQTDRTSMCVCVGL